MLRIYKTAALASARGAFEYGKDVKRSLMKKILQQAGLTEEEVRNLF